MSEKDMDWGDLRFVLETVRNGGLSGAARTLKVNHATVARRVCRCFPTRPSGS
ncbi:hypothetical protein [uncultured Tateyamaria sp.]|uniref:hypothetical protein n=1 Tax=uncultured Tateyamaria sp. TaxID=455651 RepID=UPI0026073700|nr:hypothetical protein [uncultured Tateyamaria sp.]